MAHPIVHTAATTRKWHKEHGVKLLTGWPGNSPDLNPIENLWSQMKHLQRKIARKVWREVTPEYLERLYESMPRRMQAVIAAQGGYTKY